ncbi:MULTISPECIES: cytochrome P450 [unclassified Phenylobacterium]|uniref:cytochrome P450 n=1 Tax=unclassified Phenylobacterium TaxID=2640670 RepID=UPI000839FF3D|nr:MULTISPECIES: cytochrome P450 [unclassified Phenylobacterium]
MADDNAPSRTDFSESELAELALRFDVHDPRYVKCPYFPTAALMRTQGQVVRAESYGGYWVAVSHEAVTTAARDWRHFTNTRGVVIGEDKPQKFVPEEYDPPLHSQFRRILNPFFTREAALALEPKLAALADRLIDGFIGTGEADLTEQYATPLSGLVFFEHLFNFTPEQAAYCKAAATDGMFAHDPAVRADGFARVERFVKDLMEGRRGKPSDGGFIDTVRTGTIGDRPVTDEEAVGCIQLMIVAGGDTAILAMGVMFEQLARDPGLRRRVIEDPSLLLPAIEETIRLQSPSVAIQRTVTADTELCGQQLKAGEKLYLLWGSANRDAAVFERPDDLIIDRPNIKQHIAFGAGAHKCIGEWYARAIMKVACERLLARIPEFDLQSEEIAYLMGQSRGPLAVPIRFVAAP